MVSRNRRQLIFVEFAEALNRMLIALMSLILASAAEILLLVCLSTE
jgi:hypothetical protein